jgi:hypothetical protein
MALTSKHPCYTEMLPDWEKVRACASGERAVKEADTLYLPETSGMRLDGMLPGAEGRARYDAYKLRAVFPNYVRCAVESMIGVMWRKAPVIELPTALEPLRERATRSGESLELLLRRVNEAQLMTGRLGLLADMSDAASPSNFPYLATYEAELITNWNDEFTMDGREILRFAILDESAYEMDGNFEWKKVQQHRVLQLLDEGAARVYAAGVFTASMGYSEEALIVPEYRGRKLEKIPFVFVNPSDLLPEPSLPPLLGLAELCLTIYRGEADYRQALFMQGQDTLVEEGDGQPKALRTGAGAAIHVPIGGKAYFIGVDSRGLPEMRTALENDRREAREMSAQLLDTASRAKESGEALKTRIAAQTVTLNSIARTGAAGLQEILRTVAEWVGANPEQVNVYPNLDFSEGGLTPREYVDLMTAKQSGLPLSDQSIHERLREDEYTALEFAEEMRLVEDERRLQADETARRFNAGMIG